MYRVRHTLSIVLGGGRGRAGGWRLLWAALMLGSLAAFAPGAAQAAEAGPGAVYVMTNAVSGNAVLVFERGANGALAAAGSYATGGLGTGGSLGSQGSLVLSADGRWLFAVNAGSSSISAFAVQAHGLQLASTVASGGLMPTSLAAHGGWLYVLNAGNPGKITGFRIGPNGHLSALAGSTRFLGNGGVGAAPGPAEVAFSPDGNLLVVTEKATSLIDTFTVDAQGRASTPATHPSAGVTPYGFAFGHQDTLIVSEAFGGAANGSAVSSYIVSGRNLQVASASVPTHQTAACWIAVTGDGRYAYTTDAGSGVITGYAVSRDSRLTLLNTNGQTGLTGAGPADMAISQNSRYLYVFVGGAHQVNTFRVQADGGLVRRGRHRGLVSACG